MIEVDFTWFPDEGGEVTRREYMAMVPRVGDGVALDGELIRGVKRVLWVEQPVWHAEITLGYF